MLLSFINTNTLEIRTELSINNKQKNLMSFLIVVGEWIPDYPLYQCKAQLGTGKMTGGKDPKSNHH